MIFWCFFHIIYKIITLGHEMTPRMYWDQPSLSYWSTGINQCNFYWKQCCGSISFWSGFGSANPFYEIGGSESDLKSKKIQKFSFVFSIKNIKLKTMTFLLFMSLLFVFIKQKSYFFLKIIWYSYNFSRFFYVLPGFSESLSWFYEVDQDPYTPKWSGSRWIWIHKTDWKLY